MNKFSYLRPPRGSLTAPQTGNGNGQEGGNKTKSKEDYGSEKVQFGHQLYGHRHVTVRFGSETKPQYTYLYLPTILTGGGTNAPIERKMDLFI